MQGNDRTRRQLIEKEMKAALKAKTHAELAKELVNANARLYDLDIFRDATCFVDAGERDEDVTVRVVVEEKGTHTVRKSPHIKIYKLISLCNNIEYVCEHDRSVPAHLFKTEKVRILKKKFQTLFSCSFYFTFRLTICSHTRILIL